MVIVKFSLNKMNSIEYAIYIFNIIYWILSIIDF